MREGHEQLKEQKKKRKEKDNNPDIARGVKLCVQPHGGDRLRSHLKAGVAEMMILSIMKGRYLGWLDGVWLKDSTNFLVISHFN